MRAEDISSRLEDLINEPEDVEEYCDQKLSDSSVCSARKLLEFIQPLDIPLPSMFRYNGLVVLQWDTKAFKIVGDRTIVEWATQKRYVLTTPCQMQEILKN
jgi:hypothetical protein